MGDPVIFPQRVTFIGTLEIDTEGMDWAAARKHIDQALLDGDGGDVAYALNVSKVIRMEIVEED
jgi:hypothetical protein